MKILYFQQIRRTNNLLRSTGIIFLVILLNISVALAQKPSDSTLFATDGEINAASFSGNFLYLAGSFRYIGKKTGPVAFFRNGSSKPEKNKPIFGDIRPYWSADRIFAVLPDGADGWFMAGNFYRVNNQTHNMFVHVLPDNTIDHDWDLNWEPGGHINVLKMDGGFLYVGGTMSIKDASGNIHAYVCRIDRQTKQIDPVWNPQFTGADKINEIEIGTDKIFLSGWIKEMEGYPQDALAVVDKTQGNRIPFPTTSDVNTMKLMGDTLLIGQSNLYWSSFPDGFGYIAKGVALLNEQSDIPIHPSVEATFYAAIPDESNGWYVAGRYGKDGVFHLDKDLQNITTFTQDYLTGFGSTTRLMHVGNYLYVATQQKSVVINGKIFEFLYRLDAVTGKLDTTFRPRLNAAVMSLALQGDTLFIGGDFDSIAGEARSGLCAINLSTGNLLPWNPKLYKDNFEAGFTGGDMSVKTMKINNNALYIGGQFQIKYTDVSGTITRIYGLARYDMQTGNLAPSFHICTDYMHNPVVTGIALDNDNMYLVGTFDIDVGGTKVTNAGVLNLPSQTLQPVNSELNFSKSSSWGISQVNVFNNIVYFWNMGATNTSTGESRPYFVSLNTSDNRFTKWNPQPNHDVYAFSMNDGKILLSGSFYFLKHYPDNFVGININTLKYVKFPDLEDAHDIVVSDKYIFIGGEFSKYADSTVDGLVRLRRNDLSFTSFHHKIKNNNGRASIGRLSLGTEGLYVTGYYANRFNFVNGVSRQNICLLNPETAELKAWNPPPFNGSASRIFSFGSDAIVAGDFSLMPAWKRNYIAKLDLSTNSITDWNPVITGSYTNVYSLLVSNDTVYLGGAGIRKINGQDAGGISAVSATSGTLLSGFTPAKLADGYGDDNVTVLVKNGNYLYAAGNFKKISDKSHNCIAKLNATTGEVQDWDPGLVAGWNPVNTILPLDTAVFIGGASLEVENNTDKGFLLKTDVKTGALKKVYPASYSVKIRSLAINDSGVLAAASNYSKGLLLLDKTKDTLTAVKYQPEFKYGLYKIAAYSTTFIAAGNKMKEHESYTEKPGLIIYNPILDTVTTAFSMPVIQGGINTFAANEKALVFAGEFDGMNAQINNSNIAFMQMPDLYLKSGVTSWTPKVVNTVDPFALSIYGSGFNSGSTIKLSMGNKNIVADSLDVTNRKMIAYFNGANFTIGKWDLQVEIDGNTTENFAKAINIEKGEKTEVWADWVGPGRTLANKPTTYYLLYGNKGDRDAYGILLYVAIDKNQTAIFPDYIKPRPVKGINWDTVANYVNTDYFMGEPYSGKVYTVFIPYIPGGYEGSFRITVTSGFATHSMRVAISKPIYKSYDELLVEGTKSSQGIFYNFFSCMYSVAGIAADLTPGLGCIKAAFDNSVLLAIDKYHKHESVQAEDVANSIGMTALGCIPGEAALSKGFAIAKGMASLYNKASDFSGVMGACGDFAEDLNNLFPEIIGYESHDPNAKYGPSGKDASSFVSTKLPFNYIVTFENDTAATASAQRVIVTDTLDMNVLDINTFKAVGFGFGDTSYMFKPADGDTVDIDMRPSKQIIVRVFYHLDTSTGVLTWTFLTLNPNTYEMVDNISNGFLPPNKKAPEGEGNILYSIAPLSGLAEGTKIKNSAHIVFDWNNEIPTNTWENTADNIAPESAVEPLAATSVDKNFTVHWKGTDNGSGIFSYTVFVSENDSTYYPWIVDTRSTSAIFSGEPGITYKFYTVATDSAGNKETAPGSYDAMTRVSGTGIDNFGEGSKMQFRLYPNPAKVQVNMDCYLPESSNIRLDVLNVCGHVVMDPIKSFGTRGTNNVRMDVSKLAPGYYFVRILTKYGVQIRKVIIR